MALAINNKAYIYTNKTHELVLLLLKTIQSVTAYLLYKYERECVRGVIYIYIYKTRTIKKLNSEKLARRNDVFGSGGRARVVYYKGRIGAREQR